MAQLTQSKTGRVTRRYLLNGDTAEMRGNGRQSCACKEKLRHAAVFTLASCRLRCYTASQIPLSLRAISCLVYRALKRQRDKIAHVANSTFLACAQRLLRYSHIVGKRKRGDSIPACRELRSDININLVFRAPLRRRLLSRALDCISWQMPW